MKSNFVISLSYGNLVVLDLEENLNIRQIFLDKPYTCQSLSGEILEVFNITLSCLGKRRSNGFVGQFGCIFRE
jgi:hypothetical protein